MSASIFLLPQPHPPYLIDTDVSIHQMGCVLYETRAEKLCCPIGYFSRTHHAAERTYSATEKECLAVVWALRTLRTYSVWEHFTVFTNHSSSLWIVNVSGFSRRQLRWPLHFYKSNLDIYYKKEI